MKTNKFTTQFLTALACLFLSFQTMATSLIADSFISSATWNVDTVYVYNDVIIMDTLMIMPGTQVIFSGYYNNFVAPV